MLIAHVWYDVLVQPDCIGDFSPFWRELRDLLKHDPGKWAMFLGRAWPAMMAAMRRVGLGNSYHRLCALPATRPDALLGLDRNFKMLLAEGGFLDAGRDTCSEARELVKTLRENESYEDRDDEVELELQWVQRLVDSSPFTDETWYRVSDAMLADGDMDGKLVLQACRSRVGKT